jgi:uncharacterized protein (DUF924 family)
VLSFWFALSRKDWWQGSPELDETVRARFGDLWEEQRAHPVSAFTGSPRDALAAVILFDQFPRHIFRGHADQFATDHLALAIAAFAVEHGFDDALSPPERGFLYMPFQHSESLDDQQRSLALFTALGDDDQLRFARLHHEVIERFGRFPHRNAVLGRAPRQAEVEAGDVVPW